MGLQYVHTLSTLIDEPSLHLTQQRIGDSLVSGLVYTRFGPERFAAERDVVQIERTVISELRESPFKLRN